MNRRHGIRPLMRLVAGRRRVESAVDDELQHHLEVAAEYWEARGLSPADALEEARRRFGNTTAYRAECVAIDHAGQRRQTLMDFIHSIRQDVRFALRGLARYPVFAVSVILTLALGIGASAAIFTVVDATMLRPVALPDAHELVDLNIRLDETTAIPSFSVAQLRAVRDAVPARLAGNTIRSASRTDLSPPDYVLVTAVETDIFAVLGSTPAIGRPFGEADQSGEQGGVIILSQSYWRTAFGADRGVVGRRIRLDDVSFTIIGVMGEDVQSATRSSRSIGWVPLRGDGVIAGTNWPAGRLNVIGRLSTGQTVTTASALTDARVSALLADGTLSNMTGILLAPARFAAQNPDVRRALWVLMGAVGFLWLIAVVNGTNLFLVRNAARDAELGVRMALGASRRRVMRQVLSEAVVLALASGIVAASVSVAGIAVLRDLLPSEVIAFSRFEIGVTGRVYLFVFAAAVLSGLLFGVAPAIRAAWRGVGQVSSLNARTSSRDGSGFRNVLIVGEIAIAVALLVGAGLLTRSFSELNRVDRGFDASGVMAMNISLPEDRYDSPERRAQFRDALLTRLRSMPGVLAATEGYSLPSKASFSFGVDSIQVDDGTWTIIKASSGMSWLAGASADEQYFETMRIPIVAGRAFSAADRGRTDVVIIDEGLAAKLFPGAEAVGRQVRTSTRAGWRTVVGVAGSALLLSPVGSPSAFGLDEPQVSYERYTPAGTGAGDYLSFGVRTSTGGPDARALRNAVAEIDPLLAVADLAPLEREYADTIAKPRFNSILMMALGSVALLLTLVGVYGVLSFSVAQRTRELGIRMALGADGRAVQWSVVAQALRLGVIGIAIGLVGSAWVTGALKTLLYRIPTNDVATFAGVGLLMLTAAALAAWVPSRRATRVSPTLALRAE